jgi:hypothetical protein
MKVRTDMTITPKPAVILIILFGAVVMFVTTYLANDRSAVFISGIGALGQVLVAALLFFVARDQHKHLVSEAKFKKRSAEADKLERVNRDQTVALAEFHNAKTGMGKQGFDSNQLERLKKLQTEIRLQYGVEISNKFNAYVRMGVAAEKLYNDRETLKYDMKVVAFNEEGSNIYREMSRLRYETRDEVSRKASDLFI